MKYTNWNNFKNIVIFIIVYMLYRFFFFFKQKKYLNNGCIKAYSIYSTELNRETIINWYGVMRFRVESVGVWMYLLMLFGSYQFCAENPFDFFTTKTANIWKQQMQVVNSRSRSVKAANSSPAHLFIILCICWRPVISRPAKYRKCTFMSFHYHRHYVKLTAILWDLLWDCSAWVNSEREFTWQLLHSDLCAAMWRLGQWIPARAQNRNLHRTMHARLHWSAIYLIGTECIALHWELLWIKASAKCINVNVNNFERQ